MQERPTTAEAGDLRRLRSRIGAQYPLEDRKVVLGGREWTLTGVRDQDALMDGVETDADLEQFPYGLLLWDSALGMAERIAGEPALVSGKRVLELGAGIGFPGMVVRSLGARVTQTDHQKAALAVAELNARQNGIQGIRYLLADWRSFRHDEAYDLVIGSDVLYERTLHAPLLGIFSRVLAPGGLLLVSDPLRPQAVEFTDRLERTGWHLEMESRKVASDQGDKEIALFFLGRGDKKQKSHSAGNPL